MAFISDSEMGFALRYGVISMENDASQVLFTTPIRGIITDLGLEYAKKMDLGILKNTVNFHIPKHSTEVMKFIFVEIPRSTAKRSMKS